jgi:hypothetical protein
MRGGLYGRIEKYVMDGKGIWMKGGKDKKVLNLDKKLNELPLTFSTDIAPVILLFIITIRRYIQGPPANRAIFKC